MLVHFDAKKEIKGLNFFPADEIPGNVNMIFQFYHFMVAFGMFFIGISALGIWLLLMLRERLT